MELIIEIPPEKGTMHFLNVAFPVSCVIARKDS